MGQPRPLFNLLTVFSNKQYNPTAIQCEKCHVYPVYGARIQTHNLLNMNHLSQPLDQGSRPPFCLFGRLQRRNAIACKWASLLKHESDCQISNDATAVIGSSRSRQIGTPICQTWQLEEGLNYFSVMPRFNLRFRIDQSGILFKKWPIPGLCFFIFVFSIQLTVNLQLL